MVRAQAALLDELGIPAPGLNALFIGLLECLGGVAISLGVATRAVAS